jgi:zinc protease
MKIRLLVLLLAIIPMLGAMAQQGRIKFTEYDLPNGMHVILHQDNTTPIVAVSILYHVGSKNEVPGRTGFAHFFEHLMFEGSPNIPRGEYFKITQAAGGTLNANTSQDRTFYYELLPSNQLELGLWLESERLLHLRIDSTGVETQRGVVKEERKQSYDNRPYGSIIEKTMENAYKVHPYKWTPIGYPEDLNKATLQEFMDFHSTYYVPNNATLSIAGDMDIENTKKNLSKNTLGIFHAEPKKL